MEKEIALGAETENAMEMANKSVMRKIKEWIDMADEVQQINIKLRDENNQLRENYEKERAKVYQLNFEIERKQPKKVKKVSKKMSKPDLRLKRNIHNFQDRQGVNKTVDGRETALSDAFSKRKSITF